MRILLLLPLPFLLGGCLAKAAVDVVTLPVRAVGQAADWATTSQEEADRNYGRKMRKAEAREGKERRAWEKRCRRDPEGCGEYDGYRASDESR
ncbi:hypothetical protein SAMN06297144_0148 [Sphingomonas guangdongensis]|uniref:Lipoprotein n=1 Tax=Sphingomonas guangdongensis TaxID=1141890 RepID=A0A285QA10_9SPHN|nr:hypothetical protein [Sphingomonas guangdongensis]SOB78661.1 hypothetical protein SAMN06297144_0148 [Sphingomonas guangdongensis]